MPENGEPISIAAKFGYVEIVELLLNEKRVNPSIRNNQSIIDCLNHVDMDTVTVFYTFLNNQYPLFVKTY